MILFNISVLSQHRLLLTNVCQWFDLAMLIFLVFMLFLLLFFKPFENAKGVSKLAIEIQNRVNWNRTVLQQNRIKVVQQNWS